MHNLTNISNEARKWTQNFAREISVEDIYRYIRVVDSLKNPFLRSTNDLCEAFWLHLESRFTKELGLCEEKFRSDLDEFPWPSPNEATRREDEITVGEFYISLKRAVRGMSAGLDGLPSEIHLSLYHIFVPIFNDVFHKWFQQVFITNRCESIEISVIVYTIVLEDLVY